MANATDIVKTGQVAWTDEIARGPSAAVTNDTTYYPGSLLGVNTSGYVDKFDDTQSLMLAGINHPPEGKRKIPAGSSNGDFFHEFRRPRYFVLAISGVAITDKGKNVYALDDQTGTLNPASTTFANLIGQVVDIVPPQTGAGAVGQLLTQSNTGYALVRPAYDGKISNKSHAAAKVLAATGNQTLSKFDIGKTIILPITADLTVTLPAVADTQAGDEITFIKTTTNANTPTLKGNASELIEGFNTLSMGTAQFTAIEVVSTGAAWVVQESSGGALPLVPGAENTVSVTGTLTAAQLLAGFINSAPAAGITLTLPTAANMVAGWPGAKVGDRFSAIIENTSGGANAITLAAGGATLRGGTSVAQNKSATLTGVLTNVGSGTEAYTVYSQVGA